MKLKTTLLKLLLIVSWNDEENENGKLNDKFIYEKNAPPWRNYNNWSLQMKFMR